MVVPPIIERELRAALHKRGALQSRFRIAWIAVLGVSAFMLVGSLFDIPRWGTTLHFLLVVWGLVAAVQPALAISVGLFSEERRNRTLELLYLTGVNPGELFIGKLLGAVMVASCDLLSLFPFLAVPFLSGGISLDLYLATIACLPVVLIFLVAVGSLASVMCKDDGAALVLAGVLAGVISLAAPIPFNIGEYLAAVPPFSANWLWLSPALCPYLLWKGARGFDPLDFWASTGITLAWSLLCLGLAAVMLRRNWRREVEGAAASGWRAWWESLVRGSEPWRAGLKERLFPWSPFQWLVERDRRSVLAAWLSIAVIFLLWLLGWLAWPRFWLVPVNLYSAAILFLLATGILRNYAAARRLAEDRRDGALELILTTSLTPFDIVHGQVDGVASQFRPVRFGLLGIFIFMMTAGFLARRWTVLTGVIYLVVWSPFILWCFLKWPRSVSKAAWIGLNSGRPVLAIFGSARTNPWSMFWVLFNLRNGWSFGGTLSGFPTGNVFELCFLIPAALVLAVFWAMRNWHADQMRHLLLEELRSIAQEPVPDPKDPRFKKWKDMTQRFPRR